MKKSAISISHANMRSHSSWQSADQLRNYLAECLRQGRLALVLGAGVSMACGLPKWEELVKRLFTSRGKIAPKGETLSMQSQIFLKDYCHGDEALFAEATRMALYAGYKTDAAALASRKLLTALGAMMMGSRRGNVRSVITLNFDDLLETYLFYFGYVVNSVDKVPAWSTRADVEIFHPHGLLKNKQPASNGCEIVMAQSHYDRLANNSQSAFKSKMRDILSSHICLFIGLSGDDDNLLKLMEHAQAEHVSNGLKHPFWGVRFSDSANDRNRKLWESKRVHQWTVSAYDKIPDELLLICQAASEIP